MRIFSRLLFMLVLAGSLSTHAQSLMSDLMSGKLVNPEVGVFAWYTLTDAKGEREYFLRQAVVGTEKVNRKEAFWLETELVPKVGYPSVYKMLLTGPAQDPKNVHRLIVREGQGPAQEVEVDRSQKMESTGETARNSTGMETVSIPGEEIASEHFVMEDDKGNTEIWVSDKIRPMGLVRMKSPEGELILQRYGVGGNDGKSAITEVQSPAQSAEEPDSDGSKPRTNFGGRRNKR